MQRVRCSQPFRARGAALVIVLALLALVMVLVIATLDTSRSHARHESLMADGLEADALTQLPANIVLTQLKRATTQETSDEGERVLWTSQPGMIRIFGTKVPSGGDQPQAVMHHRLYSAPAMSTPTFDVTSETAAIKQWASQPAAFTDLNEPVFINRGGVVVAHHPIADPAMLDVVDGYALRTRPPGADGLHPLPLPAAWMYVLKNGRLVMPESPDGNGVTFDAAKVTALNPVVARIAFWTDDESCKLNLNTASEPEPWDMPAANTPTERGYATRLPSEAESHRASTHPAFTSLSVVMKHFGGGHAGNAQWPPAEPVNPLDAGTSSWWNKYLACYQSLVPHGLLSDGTARQDRHFASVGEFYFAPDRTRNGLSEGFAMRPDDLRRTRFLLTTHSVAPELNPFGQPKIALWMMPKDASSRTQTDRRINTCSMIDSTHEFMFQRAANWSSTIHQGSSQSTSADWTNVPRNAQLYAWLQKQTAAPIPGVGASFVSKYGVRSRDQILTSMLDMLRWSVNTSAWLPPPSGSSNSQGLAEQSALPLTITNSDGTAYTRGFGRLPTITEVAVVFAFTDVERKPDGQPRDDNNDGICDRAAKLRCFLVLNPFIAASGAPAVSPAWSVRIRRLQHFTIGQGIGLLLPGGNARNRCTLSNSLPLTSGSSWGGGTSAYACFASQFMQPDGSPKLIGRRDDPARDFPFISSSDVTVPASFGRPGTTIRFSGGAIIVDLMAPNASQTSPQNNDSIHSVEMEFPDKHIPMPSLLVADFKNGPRKVDDRFTPVMMNGELRLPLIQRGDVVRSMILNPNGPTQGDARMLAAKRDLFLADDPTNAAWFVVHPGYEAEGAAIASSPPIAQTLRDGARMITGQFGAPQAQPTRQTAGTLLPGVSYASNAIPAVPLGLNGALQSGRLGDWETGAGLLEDGPFVNRAPASANGALTRASTAASSSVAAPLFSAVHFGAIPSGVFGDASNATPRPWQTLLFCPNPAGRSTSADKPGRYESTARDHFGFATPPDHLWLEFFWNPVTAPWLMSTDFATEGKVNMNFQVLPWTWLRRATAMHGALQGVRMPAIPTQALMNEGNSPKGRDDGSSVAQEFRYAVNADATLAAFEQRFDAGSVFRTPSEICEMFLVPKRITGHAYDGGGTSPSDPSKLEAKDMVSWWNGSAGTMSDAFEVTGDNLRESPYAQLYSRLCTQSNVYRVHYRVQVLKKARGTLPAVWDEKRDRVVSERRGSHVIERFLTPGTTLPDPATDAAAPSLHTRQRFVITSHERFAPTP